MDDLISIVTSLYNYAHYITELMDSVVRQNYKNWEHIIIDDGSTDEPWHWIRKYSPDRRFRYVRFEENHGDSFAKNEGLCRARGQYIVMIDADDLLTPGSLRCRYQTLSRHPQSVWCHGRAMLRMPDGRQTLDDRRERICNELGINLAQEYHHRLIHAQTVMVRRVFHERLGLYDERLWCSSDNEMWRRALQFGIRPLYVPHVVSIYRCHPARMSRSDRKNAQRAEIKKYILEAVRRRHREGIHTGNTRLLPDQPQETHDG